LRQTIIVKHNVEMGHRLHEQPESKCYNMHGHSWWVELEIEGELDDHGMIMDFGDVKKSWRRYLDANFDHHFVVNKADPLWDLSGGPMQVIQGVVGINCDPTVENMARIWGEQARELFGDRFHYYVRVWEASTNAATWRS
jgi:6-pyruvoyltetrahydropterin/6-carboxytetrahydropterin synthase